MGGALTGGPASLAGGQLGRGKSQGPSSGSKASELGQLAGDTALNSQEVSGSRQASSREF